MRSSDTSPPSHQTLSSAAPSDRRHDRGAVLVNVAIALVGLISFSALVIDYGVLWAARRQAQNAADAGAMAAAVSMAYVDFDNRDLARTSALNTARTNYVWGAVPDITDGDVTFPPCPPGSPGAGSNACVRVNVFRNQRANGNPLPTIFGRLIGVANQGVQATATAQVLWGDSADCVKPWAIPDKWQELNPTPSTWDPEDDFNRYVNHSGDPPAVMNPADFYERAGVGASNNGAGTGFTSRSVSVGGSDYGMQIILKDGTPQNAIAPGFYYPVQVNPECSQQGGTGGDCYREAIAGCSAHIWGPGDPIPIEPGNITGPTSQGVQALIDQDPGASWDTTTNTIVGGCQQAGTCTKTPRLIAIPAFDPDEYDAGRASGSQDIVITKIIGFFIERVDGNDVVGRLCFYPGPPRRRAGYDPVQASSFVISLALVR